MAASGDISQPVASGHFPKWGNYGENPGSKYYRGNKRETVWNQDLMKRTLNQKESDFLVSIQAGTHPSQGLLRDAGRNPIIHTARSKRSGASSRNSSVASSTRVNAAINELTSFNSNLREELQSLKGYLAQTNAKLESMSQHGGDESIRSRSSMGNSVAPSRISTARSHSQCSEVMNGQERVTTPMKEWMAAVGNLSGAEVCQPGGKPRRIKRAELKEGGFTSVLLNGPGQGTNVGGPPGRRLNSRAGSSKEVSDAITEARQTISRSRSAAPES